MPIKFSNNASSLLASGITNVATSLAVTSGHGAKFPTLGAGDYFYATIISASDPAVFEIVRVTARSTDTFTITRAQEGTTAQAWSTGAKVELRITAQGIYDGLAERLASSSYTAADVLAKLLTVDGAGSGLDADLLDGVSSASFLRSDASATNSVDLRTPIFYDSNNTAYFLDAASTTTALKVLGNMYSGSGTDGGRLYLQNTGVNYILATAGGASSSIYMETGAFVVRDFSGTSTRLNINSSGNVTAGVDFRAPIFYDSNDTARYLDPASESVINTLTIFGEVNLSAATTNYIDHTGTITFRNQSGFATSATLTTGGDFTATGNVTAYSDERLKENIFTIPRALDLVQSMRGVFYTRKDSGRRNVGVIAQEMERVLPEVVLHGPETEDFLSVSYGNLVGVLIEAVKELASDVASIKSNRS